MQTLLREDLVAERIAGMLRDAAAARLAAGLRGPSVTGRAAAGSLNGVGFWLIRVGLRLADAGAARRARLGPDVASGG